MTIEIKVGNLTDFFESAKNTAREIDQNVQVTHKNRIWVEPADIPELLRPARLDLVSYLRGRKKVLFKDLVAAMHRTSVSLSHDIDLLARYQLVRTYNEKNPGHGVRKVVEATFGKEKIELMASL